jgi:outer membrane protein OmpA-like peptidoglycan-associated protein/tetratricopeptide (TPR) repeat protein
MKKVAILLLLFWCFTPVFSQVNSKREFIKAVQEADTYFYYDINYEKAAGLYEPLFKVYPDNANLAAKLGICYLNIDGKKAEALKLLEKASSNVVNDIREYSEYGEKAPWDTYMYRAIAYHQNDSLKKAISLYLDIKKRLGGTDVYQENYIDNQIRNCKFAIEMEKKPLTIISNLFAPWLSMYPGAANPVLSKNDQVFIFTVKKEGKTQIFCSYKSKVWEKPVDITNSLGGFDRLYSNSITGDGKFLILSLDDGDDNNLYYSERQDSAWSRIKSFGKYINTVYWESGGFITPDGKTLFFVSNRPGGVGELDIWTSQKDNDGTWKRPVNCGNVINTPYNENAPFFDPVSNALIFSSEGHTGMGEYDVFRSINRNGTWTTPVCIPYAFNTTMDNSFFILNNNAPGFITSLYNEKSGSRNIYAIVAEDPAEKLTTALGTITLQDNMAVDPKLVRIQLSDLKKSTPVRSISMNDTASFKFDIKPGDYRLLISYTGYKTDTVNLSLPLFYPGSYISVNSSLVPDKVFRGDFLSIKNILFGFDSYNLDTQAKSSLEGIETILINNPGLNIQVEGYTDAKGSMEYNYQLADKRAQTAIDYLIVSGISSSRLIKKAFGKTNFVVGNVNPDGSDNPEGRKYNRRVVFGILDPQTGVVINQETYTPEHLRQSSAMTYSIVMIKSVKRLESDYFKNLELHDIQIIKPIDTDSATLYVVGVFYNKNDASKYLDFAIKNGYKDAYIVNNYEISSATKSLTNGNSSGMATNANTVYTIQLIATRNPLDLNKFKGIEGVKQIASSDGFYRYICGKYSTYAEAKAAVVTYQKSGYKDAFVKDLSLLDIK